MSGVRRMAPAIPLRDVSPPNLAASFGTPPFCCCVAGEPPHRNSIAASMQTGDDMAAILPVPTLDHVVVNVRDRIDEGLETYQRLGFTMTPRGYHTLGSMNHLAIFGTEYLELIAAQPGETRRAEILASPFGLNGLVFGTDDSASVYAALHEAGVPVEPPLEFSRPVELDRWRARRDVPHRASDAGHRIGGAPLLLPSLHPRSGMARRVAASRQRCRRRRARGDRGT